MCITFLRVLNTCFTFHFPFQISFFRCQMLHFKSNSLEHRNGGRSQEMLFCMYVIDLLLFMFYRLCSMICRWKHNKVITIFSPLENRFELNRKSKVQKYTNAIDEMFSFYFIFFVRFFFLLFTISCSTLNGRNNSNRQ